ncbi:hypothetical protein HPP92_014043 [Vanilla planifolia]|uniref:Uncharacterized protein n=1 Tax=Vanilla planifolia TaxID=51239 RepID=A0A835UX23_VANPL|nr:hypothetical protein HPP92_014043 [Vanilla planifolia]
MIGLQHSVVYEWLNLLKLMKCESNLEAGEGAYLPSLMFVEMVSRLGDAWIPWSQDNNILICDQKNNSCNVFPDNEKDGVE